REQLLEQNFRTLLSPKSMEMFLDVIERARQHIWIPTGLKATRSDGQTVPLEATVSISTAHHRQFYTVILRNVNERVEAMRLIQQLTEQTEYLQAELKAVQNFDEILGTSEVMIHLLRDVERVAITDTNVLILGETGTGKELIARAIHAASKRASKSLIK